MSSEGTNGAPQIGELNTGLPLIDSSEPGELHSRSKGGADGITFEKTKETVYNTAQSAMATVQNHPLTQNVKDAYENSPVAQSAREEAAKTSSEFRDLANARTIPEQPAATGQPLTHYHSMFYRLLSWKNPRATSITFIMSVMLIFAARYLNIIRWIFKGLYLVLGITAVAEAAGKAAFGNGLVSQIRPKKYFVIPKESLERFLDDFEQLINFFVIEFQRIVFAENVYVTGAAFVTSFLCYWLIKWLPLWGLSLIFTCVLYLAPLIYVTNKEVIDQQLERAGVIINEQAAQVRDLASQQTSRAAETVKSYAEDYSHKAQELMGTARQKTMAATGQAKEKTMAATGQAKEKTMAATDQAKEKTMAATGQAKETAANATNTAANTVRSSDFPSAPREEPVANAEVPVAQPAPYPAY